MRVSTPGSNGFNAKLRHFCHVDVKKLLGANVRKSRKKLGWTQEQLAQRSRLNAQYISRFELGQENVKVETLQKIARVLKIEIGNLFREID
jgi:transcriptional regulator with XRE-family HTH domain